MNVTEEFNNKYKEYLEPAHVGLTIRDENIVKYLDEKFKYFISKNIKFTYTTIKIKFGICRFYNTGISLIQTKIIEEDITGYLNVKKLCK